MNREHIDALEWAISELYELGIMRSEVRYMDALCRLRDAALSAPKAEAEEPCPVCAKPFAPGDTCATDIELGKCHAECLAGSPTVDLETGEPLDGPIGTFPHVAPKAEAVAWRRDWNYRGHKCAPEFTDSPGLAEQWETHPQTDKVIPLYTSPVPALTDEAVERVARAWASIDGKLAKFEDERKNGCSLSKDDTRTYEDYMADAKALLRRTGLAALLAAFPSKGEGE